MRLYFFSLLICIYEILLIVLIHRGCSETGPNKFTPLILCYTQQPPLGFHPAQPTIPRHDPQETKIYTRPLYVTAMGFKQQIK